MIVITENIEDKACHYKEWYKKMTTLIGTQFDTTTEFENSLSVGHKIHIDIENPILPDGMAISESSSASLDQFGASTLDVLSVSQKGNLKTISIGIRSTASKDFID